MLRTKVNEDGTFNSNTYNAGDEINSLKWNTLSEQKYADVFEYYKGLISFRKEHAALRLSTSQEVQENVTKVEDLGDNVVGFNIKGGQKGESIDGGEVTIDGISALVLVKQSNSNIVKILVGVVVAVVVITIVVVVIVMSRKKKNK